MEDTLRGARREAKQKARRVLILVLMEDTLRAPRSTTLVRADVCLNPCFNGRYFTR